MTIRPALPVALGLLIICSPAAARQTDAPAVGADRHVEAPSSGMIEESADSLKVTTVIQCACGGCVNQTLHECTCGYAAAERDKIASALASGATPESIVARYVEDHGLQIRITPEKKGLDLVGWAVPFAASIAALLSLSLVLLAWRRRHPSDAAAPTAGTPPEGDLRYLARLESDLKEMDR